MRQQDNVKTNAKGVHLFPTGLPEREWTEFQAQGFTQPVSGVIFKTGNALACGMPLGGIDTGCIDLELDGTLGYCTIFNTLSPRRPKIGEPFLGLNIEGQTTILTTAKIPGLTDNPKIKTATRIDYWGHYPMADLEFETETPVGVGLRAWSPFIPGDAAISNTPGIVFEVHLRNKTPTAQKGTLAITFPGPTIDETLGDNRLYRSPDMGSCTGGSHVYNQAGIGYSLGYLATKASPEKMPVARKGGHLGTRAAAWAAIDKELPSPSYSFTKERLDLGSSVALDFTLTPEEDKVIVFFLTWYAPTWNGGGKPTALLCNTYTHMYASRFWSAMEVAQYFTWSWRSLAKRIRAWQEVIYAEKELPGWLRDCLINHLHLITEDSIWAQAKPPLGDWCRKEDGLFGLNEDPTHCPQMDCLPCDMLGNFPIQFFFPKLALSTLRGFKAYQYSTGQVPFLLGGGCWAYELVKPSPGHMVSCNGPFYVVLVDRMWQMTRDENLLKEFYELVKKNTIFTMNLRSEWGPDGIVSVPSGDEDTMGAEFCEWFGMSPYVGGLHLMNLRIAKRMAEAMKDKEFARQCDEWFEQGSKALEEKLWTGDSYLGNLDPETGRKTEAVSSLQFYGEWFTFQHGLARVFQSDRTQATLETIKKSCTAGSPYGVALFVNRDGTSAIESKYKLPGCPGKDHFLFPEALILAMMYMYTGKTDYGLDLAYRCLHNVVCRQGLAWYAPNIIRGDTGEVVYGSDYYQNMVIWAFPLALQQTDLSSTRQPTSLISRIVRAGNAMALGHSE